MSVEFFVYSDSSDSPPRIGRTDLIGPHVIGVESDGVITSIILNSLGRDKGVAVYSPVNGNGNEDYTEDPAEDDKTSSNVNVREIGRLSCGEQGKIRIGDGIFVLIRERPPQSARFN